MRNCDLGLENAALGLPPGLAFLSLRILRSGSSIRFHEDSEAFSVHGSKKLWRFRICS